MTYNYNKNVVAPAATPTSTTKLSPVSKEVREEADTSVGLLTQFQESEKEKTITAATPVEAVHDSMSLQNIIAAQLTDRKFAPVRAEELDKNVTYVTASNGLFKIVKTPVALFTVQIAKNETAIPGLPPMEEGVELLIPKIPFKKILQALSFYIDINAKDKTEASVLFFWNNRNVALPDVPGLTQEGQLVTYCPTQKNSGALSDFTMDTTVPWLRENCALLLETHSH